MGDRSDRRAQNLTAALGFLRLPPCEPELQLLHRWLDTVERVGLIAVGVERRTQRNAASGVVIVRAIDG